MSLDPQAAAYLEQLRALAARPAWELPVEESRRLADEGAAALFGPADPVGSVEDEDADGVPVRIYRPSEGELPGVVYFHGGGWVVCSLESHDRLCRTVAARSGCVVISVGYRLAPEHLYPAAAEDAWTATAWAAERFAPLAAAGDSAGGQLAAVVALRARDRGLPLALQVLVYPITDYAFDTPSYLEHGEGMGLTADAMRWFWSQYLQDETRAGERDASPLREPDLSSVAPALVITAEYDPLRDEGEAYARRLEESGVPVMLHRYDGQIHGFFRMPAVIDRGREAIDEVAAAVRAALLVGAPA